MKSINFQLSIKNAVVLFGITFVVGFILPVRAVDTFISFSFDSDPGWGTEGDWEFGQPLGVAGDPTTGFSGTNVYGYNLAGSYGNFSAPHWLTTTALDCSERVDVQLKFHRWATFDGSSYPMGAIQVSYDKDNWNVPFLWLYDGADALIDTNWVEMTFDISDFADRQSAVYVRWGMGSHDPIVTNGGWNIDDVSLLGDPADPLDVTPSIGWDTTAYEGGLPSQSEIVYTITNLSSSSSLDWSAYTSESWLTVSPTNGLLLPGSATNAAVTINTTGMLPGSYSAIFQVDNLASGITEIRDVGLDILEVPGEIAVAPQLGFVVTNLIGQQQSRVMVVSNAASVGTVDFGLELNQTGFAVMEEAPMAMRAFEASAVGALAAEDPDVITEVYTFPVPAPQAVGDFDAVTIPGLESYCRTGSPIVPVQPVTVQIPAGREVSGIRVQALVQSELRGVFMLAPAQDLHFPGDSYENELTQPDPAVYSMDQNWPGVEGESVGIHEKRGVRYANVNLYPVQFNPVSGKITHATRMRIEVVLEPEPEFMAMAAMEAAPLSLLPAGGPYKHVIITSAAFEAGPGPWNFQALRDKRIAEGLPSTIITTDWIYSNYDGTRPDGGTDNPTRIRNFLIDAYENWGLEYVLLGGGIDVVPARFFRVDHQRDDAAHLVPRIDEFPVDMYYGCLSPSTCTFDYNADGFYGEPADGAGGGEVDLYAEVYVGRAPVENVSEVANFVKKTLTYADANDPYLQKVSMAGERVDYGINTFSKSMLEQVRQGGDFDGFFTESFDNHTRGDIPELDTSVNLYDEDFTWDKNDLAALVNSGVHVLNGLGHADETKVYKMLVPDIPMFTNSLYCFMYSQACENGAFDFNDCWAEEAIAMPYGPFAAVMNVRFGWGSPDSTYCPSNRYNREFWNAVFATGKMELGKANQEAKESLAWDISGPAMRWSYYELTLFGDPAQRLNFPFEPDWLSADPMAGNSIRPSNSVPVTIGFDAVDIASGSYTGEISITSNDSANPEQIVPVVMIVLPDDLQVIPEWGMQVSGKQGILNLPYNSIYTLTNSGTASLDWSVSCPEFWLETSAASGTLAAGAVTNLTVSVNTSANLLPVGDDSDTITISNTTSGASYIRTVTLEIDPPDPVGFVVFDFETDPGWSMEGEWAFGVPQGIGGDPETGYTGTNVYGYNLAGVYSNNLSVQWLTSTAMDCSAYTQVMLEFSRWLGIDAASNDLASVEVSSNGTNWIPVWTHSGNALTNAAWENVSYDISAVADGESTVYVRWAMGLTDASGTACGWNIDDVVLNGEPLPADSNSNGIPDWWEYHYFGSNILANGHADSDTYDNMDEFIGGSDPTDGQSVFEVSCFNESAGGTNQFVLTWNSLEDRYYNILWTSNLLNGFQSLENGLEFPQNTYTGSTQSASNRFYKLEVELK